MRRIIMALAVATVVSFAFFPAVEAHGSDKCSPGLIKSAQQQADNAAAQAEREQARADAFAEAGKDKQAEKSQAKADAAAERYAAAVEDLAAHEAACE